MVSPVKGINMPLHRLLISACAAALLATLTGIVGAVALRPNKVTDDSVCDLSHNTNAYLGGSVLIPGDAPYKDQFDAFFRLAATFVATKRANGQLLILQGSSSVSVDRPTLTEVANAACAVAAVSRTEVSIPFIAGESRPGFELRCVISKREDLAARLAEMERSDPLDSLKARLQAAARDPSGSGRAYTAPSDRKVCDRMTLGSILQGGRCK
jgi:hypothetical protein